MKASVLSVLLALCLLAGAGALLAAQGPARAVESSVGPNLLNNPSFEHPYGAYNPPGGHGDCQWGPCNSAQTAAGWTPYWRPGYESQTDTIVMPEYKPADPIFTDPLRVRTGNAAQVYFTVWTTHQAGFYQQVEVEAGKAYCYSVWAHSWSANDNDDAYSGPEYGNLRQRVGIDPTGGTDWQSGGIAWGEFRVQPDIYQPFVVTATAQSDVITVYAYSENEWAVEHNDTYWDDAYLGEVEPVLPDGELGLTIPADKPAVITKTVNPNWLCDPETSWEVALDPAGTFTPTLSTTSGATGESLMVTLDSNGLPPGIYETALRFSSPDTDLALPAIPVRIAVVVLDNHVYLPSLTSGLLAP